MPRARWAVAALAAVSAVGCLSLPKDPAAGSWYDPYNVLGSPAASADKVVLQTTLIEQPAGDPYLTREVWAAAGKPVPPERAALLAENGVRVGMIDGTPPAAFLKLVTSEQHTVNPRQGSCSAGAEKVIPVNGPVPRAEFAVAAEIGGPPTAFDLPAAECGLAVTPTAADGGRVKLSFEPRAQHGQRQGWLRLTADATGFTWQNGKPAEAFEKLTWDVTVGPKDYVIVGPTEVPGGKLGGAFFVTADGRARMRVLVVRASRGPDPTAATAGKKTVAAQASGTVR